MKAKDSTIHSTSGMEIPWPDTLRAFEVTTANKNETQSKDFYYANQSKNTQWLQLAQPRWENMEC
jgi:hypothetical protein